jgi:hypothetical protein
MAGQGSPRRPDNGGGRCRVAVPSLRPQPITSVRAAMVRRTPTCSLAVETVSLLRVPNPLLVPRRLRPRNRTKAPTIQQASRVHRPNRAIREARHGSDGDSSTGDDRRSAHHEPGCRSPYHPHERRLVARRGRSSLARLDGLRLSDDYESQEPVIPWQEHDCAGDRSIGFHSRTKRGFVRDTDLVTGGSRIGCVLFAPFRFTPGCLDRVQADRLRDRGPGARGQRF